MVHLLRFHGEIRWLVALVGAISVVRFAYGWFSQSKYGGLDRGLSVAFTTLLDLNLLLGLILLFGLGGGLIPYRLEHATTMILALVAAHLSAIGRRSDDSARQFRNHLFAFTTALMLIVLGVLRLRGAWIWS